MAFVTNCLMASYSSAQKPPLNSPASSRKLNALLSTNPPHPISTSQIKPILRRTTFPLPRRPKVFFRQRVLSPLISPSHRAAANQ